MYDMMKGMLNASRLTGGADAVCVQRNVRGRKVESDVDPITLAAAARRNNVRVAPADRRSKAPRTACIR